MKKNLNLNFLKLLLIIIILIAFSCSNNQLLTNTDDETKETEKTEVSEESMDLIEEIVLEDNSQIKFWEDNERIIVTSSFKSEDAAKRHLDIENKSPLGIYKYYKNTTPPEKLLVACKNFNEDNNLKDDNNLTEGSDDVQPVFIESDTRMTDTAFMDYVKGKINFWWDSIAWYKKWLNRTGSGYANREYSCINAIANCTKGEITLYIKRKRITKYKTEQSTKVKKGEIGLVEAWMKSGRKDDWRVGVSGTEGEDNFHFYAWHYNQFYMGAGFNL